MCTMLDEAEWQVAAPRRRAGGAKLKACAATMATSRSPCAAPAFAQLPQQQQEEARCYACGELARCADGTEDECARCGYFEPPARASPLQRLRRKKGAPSEEPSAARPRSLSPDSPLPPLRALAPAQPRYAASSEEEEEDGAPVDFGELPPLSASTAFPSRGPFTASASCLACSPRRRCAAHAWSAPARLAPRRTPPHAALADAARRAPLRERDANGGDAYAVPTLDAAQRARVLASSSSSSSARSAACSVDALRARMGGEKAAAAQRLDTAWSSEANEPRSRVRAMIAAGWAPVAGTWAGHPRWERTLQAGPLAGTRQVLCFSSTYSVFCWDAQTADLARMDRQARGE
jgi:hypothetical protein